MPSILPSQLANLRATGGDCTNVEVKSGAGGLPQSLTSTLSALANQPGGGTIILGLDERRGFRPVHLPNPQELKQGLAKKARTLTPPVQLGIEDGWVDGAPVIVATVHECSPSAKPCRITSTGKAFLRGYDGDFSMSTLEEQGFLAMRQPPLFDRLPVVGSSRTDLDDELVDDFTRTVQLRDRRGLGRFDGHELLTHAGVVTTDGIPTVAGLLALGTYPQQWFPRFVIQAAAEPSPTDISHSRARNAVTITGPIPRMLDTALEWAQQTFDTNIVTKSDGTVVDIPAYPLAAFRELIANALLHRDLDQWSAGMAVEVRLRRDRLVVSNPGGLYGITVDRLGKSAVTSARNMWLLNICQYLRSPDHGGRVVEALATGMPIIAQSLTEVGLPPACYTDAAIRFTAVVKSRPGPEMTPVTTTGTAQIGAGEQTSVHMSATQDAVLAILTDGPRTITELVPALSLSRSGVYKAVTALRKAGIVEQVGGPGRATVYRRTDRYRT